MTDKERDFTLKERSYKKQIAELEKEKESVGEEKEEKLSINQIVAEKIKKRGKTLLEKSSIHEQKHKELETREKQFRRQGYYNLTGNNP